MLGYFGYDSRGVQDEVMDELSQLAGFTGRKRILVTPPRHAMNEEDHQMSDDPWILTTIAWY
jgi:hypothetical protein